MLPACRHSGPGPVGSTFCLNPELCLRQSKAQIYLPFILFKHSKNPFTPLVLLGREVEQDHVFMNFVFLFFCLSNSVDPFPLKAIQIATVCRPLKMHTSRSLHSQTPEPHDFDRSLAHKIGFPLCLFRRYFLAFCNRSPSPSFTKHIN